MNDYFSFLSKKDLKTLNDNRFSRTVPYELKSNIIYELQKMYDVWITLVNPVPTNHQIDAFLKIKTGHVNGSISAQLIEQGLGKSKIALMWAEFLARQGVINGALIISPNNLKYQWVEEQIPIHFPGEYETVLWDRFGTQAKRREFLRVCSSDKFRFFSVNVEAFSSDSVRQFVHMFMQEVGDALIIVDESTTIKNGRRRTNNPDKRKGAKRTNLILDGFRNRNYKMILTGTATPNRPFDLWAQYEFLKANYFEADYWDFCKQYGEMMQVKRENAKRASLELLDEKTFRMVKSDIEAWLYSNRPMHCQTCVEPFCRGSACTYYKIPTLTPQALEGIALKRGITESGVMRIHKMEELVQFKNLAELKSRIEPITYFCKTTEVLDLPEQVYKIIPCEMTKEQKTIYKDMEKNMMAEYDGDTLTTLYKQVKYMRCQQIAGGLFPYPVDVIKKGLDDERILTEYRTKRIGSCGKLETLKATLDDTDPDQSKIYWAWFVGEQELIYDTLCNKFGSAYVGIYRGNKKEVERAFKAGEIKHFVSGDSGSFGLNLQISYLQYFYSNNHRADIRDQKEKRSHRIGQMFPVIYNDLVCKGTKDQKILDVLRRKMDLIDFFRSGEDG